MNNFTDNNKFYGRKRNGKPRFPDITAEFLEKRRISLLKYEYLFSELENITAKSKQALCEKDLPKTGTN